ncbi:hypothetical protein OHA72_09840 [Dactylosporangium sp. NBC_01737]|uniref:hypothetical protein n=1 Tax=Dactylosporangium sp. NBC_01737 TaxID=2975959 RepID=UPI002E0FAD74|nr:hypothetical protein OHA72_09840 [Dactylosporangium sp. NBC_01737]
MIARSAATGEAERAVSAHFTPQWQQFGTVHGRLYGVYFKAANKSVTWYRTDAFTAAGVTPPVTGSTGTGWRGVVRPQHRLRARAEILTGSRAGVIWRDADLHGVPPGRTRIISPYDTDARYSEKRGRAWEGYKVHFSETCDNTPAEDGSTDPTQPPNLITNVVTTHA